MCSHCLPCRAAGNLLQRALWWQAYRASDSTSVASSQCLQIASRNSVLLGQRIAAGCLSFLEIIIVLSSVVHVHEFQCSFRARPTDDLAYAGDRRSDTGGSAGRRAVAEHLRGRTWRRVIAEQRTSAYVRHGRIIANVDDIL